QPDDVRHDRRAEDADGEEDGVAAREARDDRMPADRREIRVRLEELDDVAGADREHDYGDRRLERPEPEALQPEDPEGRYRRQERRREEADAEEQVHAERGAEELGEVGGDRDRLRLQPERDRRPAAEGLAAHL